MDSSTQQLQPESLAGTKCSSFVSICVSASKRWPENLYYGDTSRDFVVEGNSLLMITAVLMCLSCALGHYVALEQPLSSCMPLHPIMRSVISYFSCERTVTYLGAFGSSSVKPVQLMSTLSLDAVVREKPRNMPESLATRGPNDQYTGKKDQLETFTGEMFCIKKLVWKCFCNIVVAYLQKAVNGKCGRLGFVFSFPIA